jgi:lipopolysaccharide transport protein LptA
MRFPDKRSTFVIFIYLVLNGFIFYFAWVQRGEELNPVRTARAMAPEFTEIQQLDYFHLRSGIPQMSLSAEKMRSQGEELAEFSYPRGVYNYQQRNETLRYQAQEGIYQKPKDMLTLIGEVKITSPEALYQAHKVKYFFKKDLILGSGGVRFEGKDLKTQDHLIITSDSLRATPQNRIGKFKGAVKGSLARKKSYEGKLQFSSHLLNLDGTTSLAHLEGDVFLTRDNYKITSGKADIYLENFNKSLKYFVLNDDVKLSETVQAPQGVLQRRAYAERLEGFGREQKMILSGAPRVEQGNDLIKGYRITIRESMDLIEVDDAMSDVQVKKQKN